MPSPTSDTLPQGNGTWSLLLAIVLLVLYIVVWAIGLLGWRTARSLYAGKSLPSRLDSLIGTTAPGVTIIRPICGLDNNLYNALEAAMKLDYPNYEIIFALQDEHDEALPVVRLIMEKYSAVDAKIIIDDRRVGVNPKVNNLIAPFEQARHDLIWVLDATISIVPGALGRAVDAFLGTALTTDVESTPLISDKTRTPPQRGDVGLVHHVPYAVAYQSTWGSCIEQAFLNTTHAKMYLAINATALDSCVMGKSNLYSRSNIASLTTPSPTLRALPHPPTGLPAFSPFLAEDNMIALGIWHQLGLKHAMTGDVALDFLGALSVRDYIDRRARWIRVRKKMTPIVATAIEPFTESIICGIYGSWAIARLLGATRLSLFVIHMVLWFVVDLGVKTALETNVKGVGPQTSRLVFAFAWLAREAMALPIWIYGIMSSEVVWRGRKYRIMASGEAERVENGRG